jgi:MOSC domain-containing protein YiiM
VPVGQGIVCFGGARFDRGVRTFEELERMWLESTPDPRGRGVVRLICVRKGDGMHECPERTVITLERGVDGDRWVDQRDRDLDSQVTLMRASVAELVAAAHAPLHAAGDNFLVTLDLSVAALPAGARIRLGGALLRVSEKPHTGCKKFKERFGVEALQWVNHHAHRERRLRGLNCRVLRGGPVAVGDSIEIEIEAEVDSAVET